MTTTARSARGSTGSLAHLLGRVALVELAVREAVARRGISDPDPVDPTRGVYLSDAYLAWLLDRDVQSPAASSTEADSRRQRLDADADAAEAAGADLRLRRLCRSCGLDALEEELLVVAAAPMLDRRFGQFYGYLNDDVTRRWATVALAVELAGGAGPGDPRQWLRLTPGSRLRSTGLLEVGDPDDPLPTQCLRVPQRVIAHLLGDDSPDPTLAAHLDPSPPLPVGDPGLRHTVPRNLVLLQQPGTDAASAAATWLTGHGSPALVLRLPRAPSGDQGVELVDLLRRERLLTGRPVVLGPVEELLRLDSGAVAVRRLLGAAAPPTVLWAEGPVDATVLPAELEFRQLAVPPAEHRLSVWRSSGLGDHVPDADLLALAEQYRVGAARIRRAVATAGATRPGRVPDRPALEDGLRAGDGAALQQLARRVRPARSWADLVLPPATVTELHELVGAVRHRDELADAWGLARAGTARGVTALFAGPSGTGKTLAAEVLTHEVGGDLYTVDLARVVDKYVGETEKNLDRVLRAADGVTGVLFFDEADALFGRRGEVTSGQDRYANLEVSYLLQRVETLGAVVLLSTNLRSQIDEAFIRRVDAVVEFPQPDRSAREAIWRRHVRLLPLDDDVDLDRCAATFELAGGNIRNAVAAAACLAAEEGRPVRMSDLLRGVEREFAKLGRLRTSAEFGRPPRTTGGGR
ncbi:ATP-binding protein [Serinicoccus sediminis]|uniref:ATP-binding protein n=1 Tax=Serinicoccus sediminis TaxID=2306021 RepID=UPI00101FF5FE|nr:ATP-binding protein [Serinicoccus sediminis]